MSHPLPDQSSYHVSGFEFSSNKIEEPQGAVTALAQVTQIALLPPLIIVSPKMIELLEIIESAGCSHAPVLITGETGTGKELIARLVHAYSTRNNREFVAFNCAAVSREMLESQLFGHQRGSFTGATHDFKGIIRATEGGTLLLDEIGELALDLQPKLLRFLQEGEVHPIGSVKPIKSDVRILAATNRDLEEEVKASRFRADLFERLHVLGLHIPPLRERREEILPLIEHFLERFKQEVNKKALQLSDESIELLVNYNWPRNVRELGNEIYRLVILAKDGQTIGSERLSHSIRNREATTTFSNNSQVDAENKIVIDARLSYAAAREQLERELIIRTLKKWQGNISQTAAALGMDRTGLSKAIKRLGIRY